MTSKTTGQVVRLSIRDWIGIIIVAISILGAALKPYIDHEHRLTTVEAAIPSVEATTAQIGVLRSEIAETRRELMTEIRHLRSAVEMSGKS